MPSLETQESRPGTDPDDQQSLLVNLMYKASNFGKAADMKKIVSNNEKSIKEQIASLQELLKEARREAKAQVEILFPLALPKATFMTLRKIMRNSDIAKRRQELMELLDEKGIPYKHLL